MGTILWVEWVKALGIPILAVAVSFATYRSGRSQVRIAREKLRHDLYNRRFAIYLAYYHLLVAISEKDDVEAELAHAKTARAESPFLLDASVGEYLNKIYKEACRIHGENKLVHEQNVWSRERAARATQLGSDKQILAGRTQELIREFDCLRLTDLSR